MDLEFENPIAVGNDVRIELTPDPGTRSVPFAYDAYVNGHRAFTGKEKRVCARPGGSESRPNHESIPVPDDLREALAAYAGD